MRYGRLGHNRIATDAKNRRRRGAVLVMTATAMVGLMVITAFAIDLSRLYVLRTELQTAADAAALAAALRLNGDHGRVVSSAQNAVNSNPALGVVADVDAVRIGIWDPEDRTFHAGAAVDTADAAQVTVGRTTTYLFGRFISDGPIRVTARATAWAGAPAAHADCVKPWFILHHDFMAAISEPHRNLTNADIRKLRDTVSLKRKLKLRLQRTNVKPESGIMYGMQLPSPYASEFPPTNPPFAENVTGCNTMEQGWVAKVERGNKAVDGTTSGLEGLCRPLVGGRCYDGKGSIGVPITVSIFCTGDEHQGGNNMWFQVEWMTGFMLTDATPDGSDVILEGYLIPAQGSGKIPDDPTKATGLLRTILVQ